MLRNQTLYLNNSGSRWITFDSNGNKSKLTLKTESGKEVTRTEIYQESFGNFSVSLISYKGKKIKVFRDSILSDTVPETMINEMVDGRVKLVTVTEAKTIRENRFN